MFKSEFAILVAKLVCYVILIVAILLNTTFNTPFDIFFVIVISLWGITDILKYKRAQKTKEPTK